MLRCVPEPAVMAVVISSGSVVRRSFVHPRSSGLFGLRITSLVLDQPLQLVKGVFHVVGVALDDVE